MILLSSIDEYCVYVANYANTLREKICTHAHVYNALITMEWNGLQNLKMLNAHAFIDMLIFFRNENNAPAILQVKDLNYKLTIDITYNGKRIHGSFITEIIFSAPFDSNIKKIKDRKLFGQKLYSFQCRL